jgi:hypothetical protein
MTDELEDLIQETEITLRDAYRRGLEKGEHASRVALKNNTKMLISFEMYVTKNYKRMVVDDELFFVDEPNQVAITLSQAIKNFLLTYDDAEN